MSLPKAERSITIAAFSDTHFTPQRITEEGVAKLAGEVRDINTKADIILHCGDFTNYGSLEGAHIAAEVFQDSPVPVIGTLGDHDFNISQPAVVERILRGGGINLLNGETFTLRQDGNPVNFIGVPGFSREYRRRVGEKTGMHPKVYDEMAERGFKKFADSINKVKGKNSVVFLHFGPNKQPFFDEDGQPREDVTYNRFGQLIEAHRSKIRLVLHGHDHHNGSTDTELRNGVKHNGVEFINLAQPVTIAMSEGLWYRLIEIPTGRAQ